MNFNDFIQLSAQLGATWGAFWGDSGALWKYFGANLGWLWAYSRRMAGVMHMGAGLVGLKSEIVHGTRATSEFREAQN